MDIIAAKFTSESLLRRYIGCDLLGGHLERHVEDKTYSGVLAPK
jgi:hypothetical protein